MSKLFCLIVGMIIGAVFAPLVHKFVIPACLIALSWIHAALTSIPLG